MRSYRKRKSLQHMWNYFLRSARLHFGDEVVDAVGLRWVDHGQPLIEQLVRNFAATANINEKQAEIIKSITNIGG